MLRIGTPHALARDTRGATSMEYLVAAAVVVVAGAGAWAAFGEDGVATAAAQIGDDVVRIARGEEIGPREAASSTAALTEGPEAAPASNVRIRQAAASAPVTGQPPQTAPVPAAAPIQTAAAAPNVLAGIDPLTAALQGIPKTGILNTALSPSALNNAGPTVMQVGGGPSRSFDVTNAQITALRAELGVGNASSAEFTHPDSGVRLQVQLNGNRATVQILDGRGYPNFLIWGEIRSLISRAGRGS